MNMKNRFGTKTLISKALRLIPVLALGVTTSTAATAAQTVTILDRVSAQYNSYKTIQTDFTFRYFRNDQDQTGQSEQGMLLLDQTDGKYRISTATQELISDGKSQWAVLKEADEVQITEVGAQEGSITPFNIFSFFKEGFTQKELGDVKEGSLQLAVIELTPTDTRRNYSKIQVRVIKSSNQLHDVTIYDKNKSRYSYSIKNLKANPALAPEKFVFDKNEFPGMEIVDLR